ncbi:DUF4258 domain-containing protein [Deinococcus sp.]|uniref:DUF4258 domain-containing protein n=1 Tax=Deinococcus sp. TaxID=47478 RepID=UPI003C7D304A
MREHTDLLTLRSQLARAEKQARKAAAERAPIPRPQPIRPLKPQREQDLEGVSTDDFSLSRAHAKLRDLVYDGQYHVCPHAVGHARAEGFLEPDIVNVLLTGRVRAIYTQEQRWLVCGYFESGGIRLPLHVVAQMPNGQGGGGLDVVTAFIPKHPHHIISRARLALLLRWDDEKLRLHTSTPGSRAGARGRGRWKKGA